MYYRGAEPSQCLLRPRVAIVGSRGITPYGREVTERLASQLAERGITIVSGLAFGVDAVTHAAALHTARSALERGIDVLVVPGNITNPNSVCCNNLIKSGATPVTSVEDILFALGADNLATTTFDQEVEVYLEFLLTLSPHLLFQDKSKRWAS